MSDLPEPDERSKAENDDAELLPAGDFPESLAARLSAAWQKREPKWYERLAPAQKHWVDKLVAIRLDEFEAHLVALDREDSQLAHQIAQVSAQLARLDERLGRIEQRLDELEAGQANDRPA